MTAPINVTPPQPLRPEHIVEGFDCGRDTLNDWLIKRANRNEKSGDSRTYVVCEADLQVVAYYSLAAGQVIRAEAPKAMTRNAPDPMSVILLGRLAIDQRRQGTGLGSALLRDASYKAKAGASVIGARALLVHALDESADAFYKAHGFVASPLAPLTLMLSFKHLDD